MDQTLALLRALSEHLPDGEWPDDFELVVELPWHLVRAVHALARAPIGNAGDKEDDKGKSMPNLLQLADFETFNATTPDTLRSTLALLKAEHYPPETERAYRSFLYEIALKRIAGDSAAPAWELRELAEACLE